MISLLFYSVFFLFSSTKIGHGRPSVKNRYAISDKNILRSYVVRYFYLKFLACRSSMPLKMYKKKGKKCVPMQCVDGNVFLCSVGRQIPIPVCDSFISYRILIRTEEHLQVPGGNLLL